MATLRSTTRLIHWSVAVAVSLILWGFSLGSIRFSVTMRLPVTDPALTSDFIVLDRLGVDTVGVTFTGEGFNVLIDQILREPEAVSTSISVHDLQGPYPERVSLDLEEDDIVFSGDGYSSLGVSSFSPRSFTLLIDRTAARDLPVALRSSSEIPARYHWSAVSHETVEVRGAESVIMRMDSCRTGPIDPGEDTVQTPLERMEGITYITPSSVSAGLRAPAAVIGRLNSSVY